jgi:two-component system, LuxR family, response regulator FixJ
MPQRPDVVCIVEDDAAVRNSLKFVLEAEGLFVRTFDGPVSFLEDRNLPPFKCLIVDYRLPVMDGLELTAALRERGQNDVIIMITGRSSKDLRERAARLGIRHLLEKPLSDGTLLAAVRDAVRAQS